MDLYKIKKSLSIGVDKFFKKHTYAYDDISKVISDDCDVDIEIDNATIEYIDNVVTFNICITMRKRRIIK